MSHHTHKGIREGTSFILNNSKEEEEVDTASHNMAMVRMDIPSSRVGSMGGGVMIGDTMNIVKGILEIMNIIPRINQVIINRVLILPDQLMIKGDQDGNQVMISKDQVMITHNQGMINKATISGAHHHNRDKLMVSRLVIDKDQLKHQIMITIVQLNLTINVDQATCTINQDQIMIERDMAIISLTEDLLLNQLVLSTHLINTLLTVNLPFHQKEPILLAEQYRLQFYPLLLALVILKMDIVIISLTEDLLLHQLVLNTHLINTLLTVNLPFHQKDPILPLEDHRLQSFLLLLALVILKIAIVIIILTEDLFMNRLVLSTHLINTFLLVTQKVLSFPVEDHRLQLFPLLLAPVVLH